MDKADSKLDDGFGAKTGPNTGANTGAFNGEEAAAKTNGGAEKGAKVPKKSRLGLIIFIGATVLVASMIFYRLLNPVYGPQWDRAAEDAPLTIMELQARAEQEPLNSAWWHELASAHFLAGGYANAARAYDQAIKGDAGNAQLWSSLGEARLMGSENDPMPAGALAAFQKAIQFDPSDPRARYFIGVHKNVSGDYRGAIGDWLALLKQTPPGAVWEEKLRRMIQQVGQNNRIDTAPLLADAARHRAAAARGPASDGSPAIGASSVASSSSGPSQGLIGAAGSAAPDGQGE